MSERENEKAIIAGVIVGAWRDDAFRKKLLDDPAGVLQDAGLTLPAGCRVTVLEDTPAVTHVAIPRLEDLVAGAKEGFMAELAARIPLSAGVELRLLQDTAAERFVVLPLVHAEMERLSDEELEMVVGGTDGNGGAGELGGFPGLLGGNGGTGGLFGSGGSGGNGGVGG